MAKIKEEAWVRGEAEKGLQVVKGEKGAKLIESYG